MAFEIFKEVGTRTKEFISVTETKAFGLSRAFMDKYGITKAHKAVILYDAANNKVALHFSLNDPKFGFALRLANPKHGATIMARSFFELKDIDSKRFTGRYDDFQEVDLKDLGIADKQGRAYVITLKERPAARPAAPAQDEVIDDEPINLDDIPF